MNRQWLFLASMVVFPAACAASPETASGEDNATGGSTRSVSAVSYSDLGTVIFVSGTSSFFEGQSSLYLRNESDPAMNTPQPIVGNVLGVAATTVDGPNGFGPFRNAAFDVSIMKDGQIVGLKVENRQCVGVYENNAAAEGVNVGAFLSCDPPASGEPANCQKTLYPNAQACLAELPRLVSVAYSDFGNQVSVKSNVVFWEGTAHLFVRNETNPAINHGPNKMLADHVFQGPNGVREEEAHLFLGEADAPTIPKHGDCIGVYLSNDSDVGEANIGAFKYEPDDLSGNTPTKRQYFPSSKRCLEK